MVPVHRRLFSLFLGLLLTTSLLSGCDIAAEEPSATLMVDWKLAAGCGAAQVITVEAKLYAPDALPGDSALHEESTSCVSPVPISFDNIPHGHYLVIVEGLNKDGVSTYTGSLGEVAVSAGESVLADAVTLSQKKGAIDVTWFFGNGMLCSANHVEQVEIAIFDGNTSAQLYELELSEPFPCDPFDLPTELRAIGTSPDLTHEIGGVLLGDLNPSNYLIYGFGLDSNGERVRKGFAEVPVSLGEVAPGIIKLMECESEEPVGVTCK